MGMLVRTPHSLGENPDDLSNHVERTIIGAIGLVLPWLLIVIAAWRPEDPPHGWTILPSISAYYYTGAVAAFVGLLVSLALFLFSYQGYDNKWHTLDVRSAKLAGAAALCVAFFPTNPPAGYPTIVWWRSWMGVVHYVGATVLFGTFAFFAVYLFRRRDPEDPATGTSAETRRDRVYLVCGIAIIAAIIWAGAIGFANRQNPAASPIFAPEAVALTFFAISWLVKGNAPQVVGQAVRSAVGVKPTPSP